MSRDELREKFAALVEEPVEEDTKLEDLAMWDSVSMVSFIALADEASGVKLNARQIRDCDTVRKLLDFTGIPQGS